MAALPPFVDHCAELLAPLGAVRVRRMFGGWGFYVDELFIAIVAFDRLYLKAAPADRERFVTAGCQPFEFASAKGQQIALSYWTAPGEALESPPAMASWARGALQAALAARAAKLRPRGRAGVAEAAAASALPTARPVRPVAKAKPDRRR